MPCRILVTMLHCYSFSQTDFLSYGKTPREVRIARLRSSLESVTEKLGSACHEVYERAAAQKEADIQSSAVIRNAFSVCKRGGNDVQIKYICLSGSNLLSDLIVKNKNILKVSTKNLRDLRNLGFVCQHYHRQHAGAYDWHIYMEDDLAIYNPNFLQKISWFAEIANKASFLGSNR